MSPRTRQSSNGAHGHAQGPLEDMDQISQTRQSKKWKHAGLRKARMQKAKSLAMSTRRNLRLNSVSGSDPGDVEELENGTSPSIVDSSDDVDEENFRTQGPAVNTRASTFRQNALAKTNGRVGKNNAKGTNLSRKKTTWARAVQKYAQELSQDSGDEIGQEKNTPTHRRKVHSPQMSIDTDFSDFDEELYNDLDAISTSEASQDELELEKQEEFHIINDVLDSGELDFISVEDLLPAPDGYSLVDVAGYNMDNLIDWTGAQGLEEAVHAENDQSSVKRVSDWLHSPNSKQIPLQDSLFPGFQVTVTDPVSTLHEGMAMDNQQLDLNNLLLPDSSHLQVPNTNSFLREASPVASEITVCEQTDHLFGPAMVVSPLQLHARIKGRSLVRNPNNPQDPFRWTIKHKSKKRALCGQVRSMFGKKEFKEYGKKVRAAQKQLQNENAASQSTNVSYYAAEPLTDILDMSTSLNHWMHDMSGYGAYTRPRPEQLAAIHGHLSSSIDIESELPNILNDPSSFEHDVPPPLSSACVVEVDSSSNLGFNHVFDVHEDWIRSGLTL